MYNENKMSTVHYIRAEQSSVISTLSQYFKKMKLMKNSILTGGETETIRGHDFM